MSGRLARLAGSLLPVLVVYLGILVLVPYGSLISQTLYRLWPETVRATRPAPEALQSLAVVPGGFVGASVDGTAWWIPDDEEGAPVALGEGCDHLGRNKQTARVVCLSRTPGELVLVDAAAPSLERIPLDAPERTVTAGLTVGRRLVFGDDAGRLFILDGALDGGLPEPIELGEGAVRDLAPAGDTVLVAHGTSLVQVATDGARPRVAQRLDLGAPARRLDGVKSQVTVAVDGAIVSVTLPPDGRTAPREISRVAYEGEPARVHVFMTSVAAIVDPARGAEVVRNDEAGRQWWGVQGGRRLAASDCQGGWVQLVCAVGDQVVTFDVLPSRKPLVPIVGALAGVLLLGLMVVVGLRREGRWIRLGIATLCVGGFGWILSGIGSSAIDALHILEYGALGALAYRAIARELGHGPAAAALAAVVGFGFGLGDESFQAVFPTRTGAMEDVWLDTEATTVGVVLGWGALRFGGEGRRLPWWPVPATAGVFVLLSAAFLHGAQGFATSYTEGHLTWISRLTPERTAALDEGAPRAAALERATRMNYGDFLRAFEHEPFLYELRVRLYRRDKRLERGDVPVACGEQQVIQRLFPETVAATSFAWSADQRARCDEIPPQTYASPVTADRITWTGPVGLWVGASGVALVLGGLALALALLRAPRRR